jgi:hypothetical protein
MSNRAAEYRMLIEEILADDAALRAQGLPGLDLEEIAEMRDILARAERQALGAWVQLKDIVPTHPTEEAAE